MFAAPIVLSPPASLWPAPTADELVWPVEYDAASTATDAVERATPKGSTTSLMALVKRLSPDERAQRARIKAEQKLRHQLDDLPDAWFVLHSVDIGDAGRHIDHVVIGPGGVFTLNVDHQPGVKVWVSEHQVLMNGAETEHLRHARFQARRSGALLTDACGFHVAAQSLLILIGAAEVQTTSRPAEVHVRTEHEIRDWLCRQPNRLDADTVVAIRDRAGRFETWQPKVAAVPPA
jgi:hypothetical protein